jgi:NAD(P)-dependent dehydrogenase (short-subunit alcohol dehydrogenase family)
MGRPDDVAGAVAFLASADARWITGITLPLGWAYHYPLPTGQMMG